MIWFLETAGAYRRVLIPSKFRFSSPSPWSPVSVYGVITTLLVNSPRIEQFCTERCIREMVIHYQCLSHSWVPTRFQSGCRAQKYPMPTRNCHTQKAAAERATCHCQWIAIQRACFYLKHKSQSYIQPASAGGVFVLRSKNKRFLPLLMGFGTVPLRCVLELMLEQYSKGMSQRGIIGMN